MNLFAAPASGINAWHRSVAWHAHARAADATLTESGRRVWTALFAMGENAYGDFYDYHRRMCVVARARDAARGPVAPPDGQLVLAMEVAG